MRLKKNSKPYTIIKYASIVGETLLIPLVTPYKGTALTRDLIARYVRGKRFERKKLLQDVKRLQERKLIDYRELPDGMLSIVLTNSGKHYALRYRLDEMKIANGVWDKRWRIILFDIPHRNKKAREAFRTKLKALGCLQLQKSAYITPWPCSNEIDFLTTIFEIPRSNIFLFETRGVEGEGKLKRYFNL